MAIYRYSGALLVCILIISMVGLSSCKPMTSENSKDDSLDKSLDLIEEVVPIQGAENVTVIVNNSNQFYFNLEFLNIEPNDVINDGVSEGWCIDWETPISTQNGTYTGVQLYSTYGVEKWKEVNALLTIREQLKTEDSSITFREIQAAIWVLRPHPAFDLNAIDMKALPSDMVRNGELLFDTQKVRKIVEAAESHAKAFAYGDETKFAIIAETPVDVQTVITVVSKK